MWVRLPEGWGGWANFLKGWAEVNVMIGFFAIYCECWNISQADLVDTCDRVSHTHFIREFPIWSSHLLLYIYVWWKYTNVWFTQYMPWEFSCLLQHRFDELTGFSISSINTYDNTGKIYDVTRIISPNGSLDEQAYKAYSPLYIPLVIW